jgi:hypothetical protein
VTDAEYIAWGTGVLGQITAPDNLINRRTLDLWTAAEGGRSHMNPLNTTWFIQGAQIWNTLPSGIHVWSYASVPDAVMATVNTLLTPDAPAGLPNGYDVICDNLRNSVPAEKWQNACWQLNKWGTGCGWLPSAPVIQLGEKDMQTFVLKPVQIDANGFPQGEGEEITFAGPNQDTLFNFVADGQNDEIGVLQIIASQVDGTYYALTIGPSGTISLESAKFGSHGPKQAEGRLGSLGITGPCSLYLKNVTPYQGTQGPKLPAISVTFHQP